MDMIDFEIKVFGLRNQFGMLTCSEFRYYFKMLLFFFRCYWNSFGIALGSVIDRLNSQSILEL